MLLSGMIVMLTSISCSDKKTATKEPEKPPTVKTAAVTDPLTLKLDGLKKSPPADMGAMEKNGARRNGRHQAQQIFNEQ